MIKAFLGAVLLTFLDLNETLAREVFRFAKSESIVKIEVGPFFGTSGSFVQKSWAELANGRSYKLSNLTSVFFVKLYLRLGYFYKF